MRNFKKMGRNTTIYKLDKKKAKLNLYSLIIENEVSTIYENKADIFSIKNQTFKDYIAGRNLLMQKYNQNELIVNYELILEKVKTDINEILPEELFVIERWISENCFNFDNVSKLKLDEYDALLEKYGIEKLLEIDRKSSYSFMNQLSNFDDEFLLDAIKSGSSMSCNIKSYDFIRFLDYLILFTKKLIELNLDDNQYAFSKVELEEIINIENLNTEFEKIETLVNFEINLITDYWNEFMKSPNGRDENKYGPQVHTVFYDNFFFRKAFEMKNKITDVNLNIIICDSI